MTVTIRTKLSDDQRNSLLHSLGKDKIGIIYDDAAAYVVASTLDSDSLIGALDELQVQYNIVNDEEVVHTFRNREDFKLAGNLNIFPMSFIPGL